MGMNQGIVMHVQPSNIISSNKLNFILSLEDTRKPLDTSLISNPNSQNCLSYTWLDQKTFPVRGKLSQD